MIYLQKPTKKAANGSASSSRKQSVIIKYQIYTKQVDESLNKRDQKQKEKLLPFKKQEFVKGQKKEEEQAKNKATKKGKGNVSDTSSVRIKQQIHSFQDSDDDSDEEVNKKTTKPTQARGRAASNTSTGKQATKKPAAKKPVSSDDSDDSDSDEDTKKKTVG